MKKTPFVALLFTLVVSTALAQRAPHFDVLLFSLTQKPDSTWQAGAPRFLTAFNPKGYNNQPSFFGPNEIYLTVQMPDDTTQTDIWLLDLGSLTRTRVTATERTAEYSPTLMPGGKRWSAVRVEEDGSQRLWSFPLDRSDNGRPEFPRLLNVGYHCWLRDTLAAFFIVGENNAPHVLQLVGTRAQRPQRIASNIGRCLLKTPAGHLAFVQKATEQTWFLKTYDLKKQFADLVIQMPAGGEDLAILPDGTYLAGSGSRLFQYHPRRDTDWREVLNFSKFGIKNITRLAVNKEGKLAVVVSK